MSKTEGELQPFLVGESYKVWYKADRKPHDRPGRPLQTKCFMGTFRGMSPDGLRWVFVTRQTSHGIRPDQLKKWEHLDWVKRNVEA